ncbi:hypothetical protein J5N97_005880 [Dioscorea zingiberensis]|uniref:Protein BIG GRAIN 1-like n=1 Tax=Dioscorea zingiberensis TaxID=325984 RepID=A0A9D5D9X0_9LILI|nr:hypothetical protein J5N97_005880 [Dioscorea zingiberensis]
MEKPQACRARDTPSFSSSLLDAIYRSLDDEPGGARDPITRGASDKQVHHSIAPKFKQTFPSGKPTAPVSRPRSCWTLNSSSSSSDVSSSAGFSSSSEPESGPSRLRPIRTSGFRSGPGKSRPDPPPPEKNTGSVKSRARDPRRPKTPASPGARLAGFLGSLFATSAAKKPAGRAAGEDSVCSSATSFSRSCLSVTPSSRGTAAVPNGVKRSVRFCDDGVVAARKPETKRGVRGDVDTDDVASDGSSDLFELEDLTVVGGLYKDELPVYGTTSLGGNRVISRGMVL